MRCLISFDVPVTASSILWQKSDDAPLWFQQLCTNLQEMNLSCLQRDRTLEIFPTLVIQAVVAKVPGGIF